MFLTRGTTVALNWAGVVMKRTISTFKTYFLSTLLGSAVLAGTYADLKLKSNAFMFENKIDIVSFTPEQTKRIVASRVHDFNLPAVSYLGVNEENKKKINGKWEVTRVLDTKGNAIYDSYKNANDKKSIVIVKMEMVSTSTVVLDKDKNQTFKISLLTDKNTIALFKVVNGGYEILEAKKLIEKPRFKRPTLATTTKLVEPTQKAKESKKGIRINDMDLLLESALNPLQSRNILNVTQVNGSLSVFDGSIQDFRASLNSGSNKEVNLDFSFAEIKDGGQFETDIAGQIATGIISNNGENSYKVRFATGPLQGAILTFVTREKYDQTQEKFANFEETQQPAPAQNARPVRPINTERNEGEPGIERVPAEELDNEEDVVLFIDNEKKLEHVKKYGFSFGKSERKPASVE
ncbi:MAG: hypothetical protein ACJAT2_003513 [Bacteriovoracaceae bacterium]